MKLKKERGGMKRKLKRERGELKKKENKKGKLFVYDPSHYIYILA